MATRKISRSSIFTTKQCFSSLFIRSYTKSASPYSLLSSPSSYLSSRCLRPISAHTLNFRPAISSSSVRCFNSDQTNSDSNPPNKKSSPPEETDVLEGFDSEHWKVAVDLPEDIFSRNEGVYSRNDIIDFYIKTLATIVGSEEEARMKIYNVHTRGYHAFGVLMSEELAYKMMFVENVRSVIPDSYWDAENKDYGGEQFINGQAMPYIRKYAFKLNREHVTNWTRRFNERIRRNVQRRNYMGRDPQNMLQNNMGGMSLYSMGGISQDNFGGAQKMGTRPNYMVGGVPIKKGGESSKKQMTNSYSNPPNKSSPTQETDVFDGCDYEHWIVAVDFTDEEYKYFKRDDVIDFYIKTLATIVGGEEEARMKIYNVRTKGFQAFGVLMSEELAYKLTFVENVQWVIPDAYWDVENKDYGGEPFINGQAMPYDPKYDDKFSPEHVTNWMRRAKERNSRNGLSRYYMGRYPHISYEEYQGLGHGPWNMGGSWNKGRSLRNNMGRMLLYTEEYGKNVAVYGRNVKQ